MINLLDPTTIVDRSHYAVKDIKHLFIRRHRHSPDVAREVGDKWAERPEPEVIAVEANPAEEAVAVDTGGPGEDTRHLDAGRLVRQHEMRAHHLESR